MSSGHSQPTSGLHLLGAHGAKKGLKPIWNSHQILQLSVLKIMSLKLKLMKLEWTTLKSVSVGHNKYRLAAEEMLPKIQYTYRRRRSKLEPKPVELYAVHWRWKLELLNWAGLNLDLTPVSGQNQSKSGIFQSKLIDEYLLYSCSNSKVSVMSLLFANRLFFWLICPLIHLSQTFATLDYTTGCRNHFFDPDDDRSADFLTFCWLLTIRKELSLPENAGAEIYWKKKPSCVLLMVSKVWLKTLAP